MIQQFLDLESRNERLRHGFVFHSVKSNAQIDGSLSERNRNDLESVDVKVVERQKHGRLIDKDRSYLIASKTLTTLGNSSSFPKRES